MPHYKIYPFWVDLGNIFHVLFTSRSSTCYLSFVERISQVTRKISSPLGWPILYIRCRIKTADFSSHPESAGKTLALDNSLHSPREIVLFGAIGIVWSTCSEAMPCVLWRGPTSSIWIWPTSRLLTAGRVGRESCSVESLSVCLSHFGWLVGWLVQPQPVCLLVCPCLVPSQSP